MIPPPTPFTFLLWLFHHGFIPLLSLSYLHHHFLHPSSLSSAVCGCDQSWKVRVQPAERSWEAALHSNSSCCCPSNRLSLSKRAHLGVWEAEVVMAPVKTQKGVQMHWPVLLRSHIMETRICAATELWNTWIICSERCEMVWGLSQCLRGMKESLFSHECWTQCTVCSQWAFLEMSCVLLICSHELLEPAHAFYLPQQWQLDTLTSDHLPVCLFSLIFGSEHTHSARICSVSQYFSPYFQPSEQTQKLSFGVALHRLFIFLYRKLEVL